MCVEMSCVSKRERETRRKSMIEKEGGRADVEVVYVYTQGEKGMRVCAF